MSLANSLRSQINEIAQKRGEKLFESNQVVLQFVSENRVQARILGGEGASTVLELNDAGVINTGEDDVIERVQGFCDCAHFDRHEHCEHIYALALKASTTVFAHSKRVARFLELEALPAQGRRQLGPIQKTDFWREDLQFLKEQLTQKERRWQIEKKEREQRLYIWYVVEPLKSGELLTIFFYERRLLKDGSWGRPKKINLSELKIHDLPSGQERRALLLLKGGVQGRTTSPQESYSHAELTRDMATLVLDLLHSTGRLGLILDDNVFETAILPLSWSAHKTICERPAIESCDESYQLVQSFYLGDKAISKKYLIPFFQSSLALWGQELLHLKLELPIAIGKELFRRDEFVVPADGQRELVELIRDLKTTSQIALPQDFPLKEQLVRATPCIEVEPVSQDDHFLLYGRVGFEYDGIFHFPSEEVELEQSDPYCLRLKDLREEESALALLKSFENIHLQASGQIIFDEEHFAETVNRLKENGFVIKAFGKKLETGLMRSPQVISEYDWFEVKAGVRFEDLVLTPPEILKRLETNRFFVRLDDQRLGLIPEKWLKKIKVLSQLGTSRSGSSRLPIAQALLLEELFDGELDSDKKFKDIVKKYRNLDGLKVVQPSNQFRGTLRSYQRIGLSWMCFLEEIGLGGCLADDMGLGKTIQVLAYIQKRKRKSLGAFLIVVPKSLISNWQREAKQFTPNLVVRVYEGRDRKEVLEGAMQGKADILLTTYGVLRRDHKSLSQCHFDGIVLDEAQNIKNAKSQTAKSAFALKGDIRLALTGTPVENHIGELFSLFKFLIPGLFKAHLTAHGPTYQAETLNIIMKGLRPFILRRHKDDVLSELPPKTENTIFCEMGEDEKKEYDRLKRFYQGQLNDVVKQMGLKRSSFHVLEGLLRLRQFACHPKLMDADSVLQSTKVQLLLEHLDEIAQSKKKALVFSQFTSFLKIIAGHLKERGIEYSYLDGQTRDRDSEINSFNNDIEKTAFLISLKAGGTGLNLTAASYCFILDPWWNPAVENQAIDRIHRIGQSSPVFVYRIITRDTVEQRVLELQATKKEIEGQVLSSDKMFLSKLSQSDFVGLLS